MKHLAVATFAAAAMVAGGASAQTFSVGSNPQGSLAYSTAAAISKVAIEVTGLKMRVVPQGGPVVTLPLVNNGELDFSITVSIVAGFANQGRAMFKKSGKLENVRIVASLFALELGFFVRKDSAIKTLADLRGKRLATKFTKQKVVQVIGAAKLATVGLTYGDVIGHPVPNGVRQIDDFMAGKIDAVTFSLSSGKTVQAHAKVGGIRVLSLPNTPAALKAMQKVAPGSIIKTINPGPRYPGVTGPTNIMAAPFLLTASTKTPADVVYRVAKSIYENKKKLVASHKAFNGMRPDELHRDLGLPYHRGALKFYKEKGI